MRLQHGMWCLSNQTPVVRIRSFTTSTA